MKLPIASFRECISTDPQETVVFATDILSQPQYRKKNGGFDPLVYTKCARAIPIAREGDIVVTVGDTNQDYYGWLRTLGLGPREVVSYPVPQEPQTVSEMIAADPTPVLRAIERTGKSPVYVPFYSGDLETSAARILNASLLGCEESITRKYFNKDSFKEVCLSLKVPTISGTTYSKGGKSKNRFIKELVELTEALLHHYPKLVIRGAEGAAGSSVHAVDKSNIEELRNRILQEQETNYLLEPMLSVVSSPNDQWVIDRNGTVRHLGVSTQLFNDLKHVGNLKGIYFSDNTMRTIIRTSAKLVHSMKEYGYKGVIGIDYIVSTKGTYPIENNARLNGSTFVIALTDELTAKHGPLPFWKFYRAQTDPCSFKELSQKLGKYLYQAGMINQVFPFDCDTLGINGQFTPVIFAEDFFYIEYLEKKLEKLGITRI